MTYEKILSILDEHPTYLIKVEVGRLYLTVARDNFIYELDYNGDSSGISIYIDHSCNHLVVEKV